MQTLHFQLGLKKESGTFPTNYSKPFVTAFYREHPKSFNESDQFDLLDLLFFSGILYKVDANPDPGLQNT